MPQDIIDKKSYYVERKKREIIEEKKKQNKEKLNLTSTGAERGRDVPFVWEAPCVLLCERKY